MTGLASLGARFPAAHQYLRMKLIEETYPIAPSVSCRTEEEAPGRWRVELRWPEIDYTAEERFEVDDLRAVFGRWSTWARRCALDISDRLPV